MALLLQVSFFRALWTPDELLKKVLLYHSTDAAANRSKIEDFGIGRRMVIDRDRIRGGMGGALTYFSIICPRSFWNFPKYDWGSHCVQK